MMHDRVQQVALENFKHIHVFYIYTHTHIPDEHIGSGLFDEDNGAAEARQTIQINSRLLFQLKWILLSNRIKVR
jgi:hypothetical protein